MSDEASANECEKCRGANWIVIDGLAHRCECMQRRIAASRLQTIAKEWTKYIDADLDVMTPRSSRQAAAIAAIKANPAGSYYLWGSYDAGKTHLLIAQYRILALRRHNCLVRSGRQLVEELRRAEIEPRDGEQRFISPVLQATYSADQFHLFWDDINKADARTGFRAEALFDLLDTLKRRELAVTITSQRPLIDLKGEVADLRTVIGHAAVARIDAMCTKIQL